MTGLTFQMRATMAVEKLADPKYRELVFRGDVPADLLWAWRNCCWGSACQSGKAKTCQRCWEKDDHGN